MSHNREKSWLDKLRYKYRMVILNDDTLEERLSFHLSRLNLYIFGSTIFLILSVCILALLTFTPLKYYIPGYGDTNMRRNLIELTYKSDSLERIIKHQNSFIGNIKNVLTGDIDSINAVKDKEYESQRQENEGEISDIISDSLNLDMLSEDEESLRNIVEQTENYQLSNASKTSDDSGEAINFNLFSPVNGYISGAFDYNRAHFGIDVVAAEDETIKAAADGIVILADWTLETGHVIGLQHQNNLVSFYKHNSVLLKKVGNFVKAGDVIAIIGGSGEESTGPHLHLELWHNQKPLNPTDHIDFN